VSTPEDFAVEQAAQDAEAAERLQYYGAVCHDILQFSAEVLATVSGLIS